VAAILCLQVIGLGRDLPPATLAGPNRLASPKLVAAPVGGCRQRDIDEADRLRAVVGQHQVARYWRGHGPDHPLVRPRDSLAESRVHDVVSSILRFQVIGARGHLEGIAVSRPDR